MLSYLFPSGKPVSGSSGGSLCEVLRSPTSNGEWVAVEAVGRDYRGTTASSRHYLADSLSFALKDAGIQVYMRLHER